MSDTAALAALVGVAPDVLVRALGDAWTEVAGPPHERWFVSGEPAQVAVGWDGFSFTLARPEPRWSGHRLVWEFVPDRRFSSDEVLYERAVLAEAAEEAPRGVSFLYDLNRLNVAVSRAKSLAVVVMSPLLLDAQVRTPEQLRQVNAMCRLAEMAGV